MPLAVQAILPLAVLLGAGVLVRLRPRHRDNGWIACSGTAIAAAMALIELIRLSPGEHVDVPYLTTFPYADLAVRLDGLSLAFVSVTLATAALLMLIRQHNRGDRRDPWLGWLLTTAAACSLMLAANLLLLYIVLQVLTLAWSGALDERAPRRRGLRLTLQIADIGLLLAGASAIQSVGTASYSGVPSDTFGIATFWLVLLPVGARIVALAWGSVTPIAGVTFEPAIAWLAPAAYLLLRLLALMGGRLPDRPTAVILFVGAAGAAIVFAGMALWRRRTAQLMPLLLTAQAATALALSSGSEPLLTIASTWMWLSLIPLAGLVSMRVARGSVAEGLTLLQLAMIPGSLAFIGIWLGGLTLNARGLVVGVVPIAITVVVCALATLGKTSLPRKLALDPAAVWAIALMVFAALPVLAMDPLVIPAAATVRIVPSGTLSLSPLGANSSFGIYPAAFVSLIVAGLLAFAGWFAPGHFPLLRGGRRAAAGPGGRKTGAPRQKGRRTTQRERVRTSAALFWADARERFIALSRESQLRDRGLAWAPMFLWAVLGIAVGLSLLRP